MILKAAIGIGKDFMRGIKAKKGAEAAHIGKNKSSF
jgi:hypothetical protein